MTSAGWVLSAGESIAKHCEAVLQTSGWSHVAETKPRGLSKRFEIEDVRHQYELFKKQFKD